MDIVLRKMEDSKFKWLKNALKNTTDKSTVQLDEPSPECFLIFKTYIDPVIYLIIVITGLALNGTLLLIFARHREIRTTSNVMIFNLAICDFLNICINAPMHYMFPYYHNKLNMFSCRVTYGCRQFFSCISAISLAALSVQRFCATFPRTHGKLANSKCRIGLYVVLVWVSALGISVPPICVSKVYKYLCSNYGSANPAIVMVVLYAIFYCIVFLAFIVIFNLLTARRLRVSAQQIPGENLQNVKCLRKKSANIVTSLAILYVVSHAPYWIWCAVVYSYKINRLNEIVLFTQYVFKYLLFAHACFNPVALYKCSNTFKRLFRRHVCCSEN